MKTIRFTLLSIALAAVMVTEVDAQQRGNGAVRSEHRSEGNRPNPALNRPGGDRGPSNHRIENNRNDNRREQPKFESNRNTGRETVRHQDQSVYNRPNHEMARVDHREVRRDQPKVIPNGNRNDRREPIRINNSKGHINYSYNKPVRNININHYHNYSYNNMNFYGHNGIFYRYHNNNYYRITPPLGFRINFLPSGYITINIGSRPYYFYEGVYYERYLSDYRVVEPPVGAIVYALPSGYERIDYYGNYYYEFAGVLYDKIYYRGETAYQVVGYLS